MKLYEILVPITDNKGTQIPDWFHHQWDAEVHRIAGGLTILTPIKGQWISTDNRLFIERVLPVRIACTEEQINLIADFTANRYNQKSVMFYEVSSNVQIKNY